MSLNSMSAFGPKQATMHTILSWMARAPPKWEHSQLDQKRTIIRQSTILCNLPTEILLEIIEYLPLSSQSCLIFTCKSLNIQLGDRSWACLRGESDYAKLERKAFIRTLARDYPLLLPCHTFKCLHKRNDDTKWTEFERVPGCVTMMCTGKDKVRPS